MLALVAEGLTNAELAERLYISPRTAGVHVSNILAKLGMSSRTEAAAWAVRSGLGAAPDPPKWGVHETGTANGPGGGLMGGPKKGGGPHVNDSCCGTSEVAGH